MKIALLATKPQNGSLAALKESFPDGEIAFCDLLAQDAAFDTALEGADVVLNLIEASKCSFEDMDELNRKFSLEPQLAEISFNTVAAFNILHLLDRVAESIKKHKPVFVLNAGYPSDLITLYLNRAHNIKSYSVSLRADRLLDTFLSATGLAHIKDASFKAAGRPGNLWITEVCDNKGKDIYPQARKAAAGASLNIYRHSLARDALAALKFYGYYHSGDTPDEDAITACASALAKIYGSEKSVVYLGVINNGAIADFDDNAIVEIACRCGGGGIKMQEAKLPLPCALATNDYISALSVAAEALTKKSQTLFKRTVKLDPYLSSILSLKELEEYARALIGICGLEKAFSKEAL